ncbi:MAG: TlpA family protein disulfide reductase [Dysgonamonadaceae bacterium]|jgi:thiol-disulfide isomerase/thioredoxin|nr:TlpA family protein disulfide reductase [Dysgonamonadaceae bacterium]
MKTKYYLFFLMILSACTPRSGKLQDGIWRGELAVADNKQAPFLFEVKNANTDSAAIILINGEERVPLTGITYSDDTAIIPIASFDARIEAKISNGLMEGWFFKNYIENDEGILFRAKRGEATRFEPVAQTTSISIDGKWDISFIETSDTSRNVGIFTTENLIVTGSVLTHSGDLRFLEGIVTEDGVKLSAFSGLSPYLIEIRFLDENTFQGEFYTAKGITKLSGTRNDKAALDEAYSRTAMKPGFDRLHFRLPNMDGKLVSLDDELYKGKVVIVSILGSWCPNCLDEARFLAPWYKENNERGVEILGLAFERKADLNYAKETINRLKKAEDIRYEILFAGKAAPATIAEVLPEIAHFSSYPTTVFINRQGKVSKIHAGFSGPATGLFYREFQAEFNALVDSLLDEKTKN